MCGTLNTTVHIHNWICVRNRPPTPLDGLAVFSLIRQGSRIGEFLQDQFVIIKREIGKERGVGVNKVTRTTRACTMDALNEGLKSAIRAHGASYGLNDMETDILMCCETTSVSQSHGLFGGTKTTLSAAFITPKWLVWADSTDQNDAGVGSAQLKHIDVRDYQTTASHSFHPDQGLNITGRYTNRNKTGITFIVLASESDGQQFRQILKTAMSSAMK
jgi:hypothetical protein